MKAFSLTKLKEREARLKEEYRLLLTDGDYTELKGRWEMAKFYKKTQDMFEANDDVGHVKSLKTEKGTIGISSTHGLSTLQWFDLLTLENGFATYKQILEYKHINL